MAAILDAILNFCSRVTKVHPADSENGPPRLPKTVEKKKLFEKFPGSVKISHLSTGLRDYSKSKTNEVSLSTLVCIPPACTGTVCWCWRTVCSLYVDRTGKSAKAVLECMFVEVAADFDVGQVYTGVRRETTMMTWRGCLVTDVISAQSLCFSSCVQFVNAQHKPNWLVSQKTGQIEIRKVPFGGRRVGVVIRHW